MSDTPLTDSAEYSMYGSRPLVDADFARELERQLIAANARIVELQGRLIAQENNLEKKELATDAMLAVNDFMKHHIKKTRFLRKKREYAENKLASANNRINALVSNFSIMLDQRSADVDEINRLERLLESANKRIAELNTRLLDARR